MSSKQVFGRLVNTQDLRDFRAAILDRDVSINQFFAERGVRSAPNMAKALVSLGLIAPSGRGRGRYIWSDVMRTVKESDARDVVLAVRADQREPSLASTARKAKARAIIKENEQRVQELSTSMERPGATAAVAPHAQPNGSPEDARLARIEQRVAGIHAIVERMAASLSKVCRDLGLE